MTMNLHALLAHDVRLKHAIARDGVVHWNDVDVPDSEAVQVRRESEALFGNASQPVT